MRIYSSCNPRATGMWHQRKSRQDRPNKFVFQSLAVGLLAFSLASCTISRELEPKNLQPELVSSTIVKPAAKDGLDSGDTELIKTAVVNAGQNPTDSNMLAWNNPETGNRGTITAIEGIITQRGRTCKKFQTTVDTFMGISLYDGETCELRRGLWVLSRFFRIDTPK